MSIDVCDCGAYVQLVVESQVRLCGYDPKEAIIEVQSAQQEHALVEDTDLYETIEQDGESIALILISTVHYLTGQVFDTAKITALGRAKVCGLFGGRMKRGIGGL